MKVRSVIALIVLAYLLTLVIRFPADWGFARVDTAPVVVDNPSGTVWHGNAARIRLGVNQLEAVNWIFNPLALTQARVGADITFGALGGHGLATLAVAFDGDIYITQGDWQIEAQTLAKQLPGELVQLGGRIQLLVEEAHFAGQQPQSLLGELIWHNAALKSPVQAELGVVTVTISPDGGGHAVQLNNTGGVVRISGKINIDTLGGYRADIKLKPLANAPADLDGTLGLLGRKGSDGSYSLRQNGRLRDLF